MWKNRFILFGWTLLGIATVVLLIAAMEIKNHKTCSGINLVIEGARNDVFINDKYVLKIVNSLGPVKGKDMASIDVNRIEELLENDAWIKNAELFFDNNLVLQVKITEREPLARIFTIEGSSFYIDSSGKRLPLSSELSARVPVFTSFSSNKKKLSAPDSVLLDQVKKIALFIQPDSFWMSLVSQVDITPQGTFQIIPLLGNQVIELGTADSLQAKFDRLFSFYKEVWPVVGFEKYEKIDVQFSGQVVATRRGAWHASADSVKAMQQLRHSVESMSAGMTDNVIENPEEDKSSMLLHPVIENKAESVGADASKADPPVKAKPKNEKKPAKETRQPKAVMKKKNVN